MNTSRDDCLHCPLDPLHASDASRIVHANLRSQLEWWMEWELDRYVADLVGRDLMTWEGA